MTQKEFDEILLRYLHNACSDQERIFVENWFENLQREEIFIPHAQELRTKGKIWNLLKMQSHINTNSKYKHWKSGRIAASIAVLALCFFIYSKYVGTPLIIKELLSLEKTEDEIYFTNKGTKLFRLALKDGSSILVHPGSEVRYPKTFGTNREIHLSGEAFFEIAKDPNHPFIVHASEITTRVLGTSFRVKAYKEQKEIVVAVTTGKVSVFFKSESKHTNQEVILTPNQQIVYNRDEGRIEKRLIDSPRILISNLSTEMVYTNEPVAKLFKALEKMYGVTIQFDEKILMNCNITTEMTDEGLFERMNIICDVLNAKYKVEDAIIIVEANGCSK